MSRFLIGLTSISILWTVVSLLYQWFVAWGGGRRDLSQQSGEPGKGMIYNFTVAMLPSHKETVRLHLAKFAAGIIMHTGAFFAILITITLLGSPELFTRITLITTPVLFIGLLAAIFLAIRRLTSPLLRTISCPDDHFAVMATAAYILMALLLNWRIIGVNVYLLYSALFFIYLPLGKLRHALFFFLARGDYGRRLGYRGVYPIPPTSDQ